MKGFKSFLLSESEYSEIKKELITQDGYYVSTGKRGVWRWYGKLDGESVSPFEDDTEAQSVMLALNVENPQVNGFVQYLVNGLPRSGDLARVVNGVPYGIDPGVKATNKPIETNPITPWLRTTPHQKDIERETLTGIYDLGQGTGN